MITARIAQITHSLRRMTPAQADRALCDMTRDDLLAVGEDLGLRLPYVGGDKPAQIVGALFPRAH